MAHMLCTPEQQHYLLCLARQAISRGLTEPETNCPEVSDVWLQALRATFVTLKQHGQLRGCIGSLQAQRPLQQDIWHNARAAAFNDPRFAPLTLDELDSLDIELSILSDLQPLKVGSEEELLQVLRPNVDGLLIEEGNRRATFLPSVWQQLPDPIIFLAHLRQKAGMPAGFWSEGIRCSVYQVEKFTE